MPGFVDVHNHHALAGRTELYELSVLPVLVARPRSSRRCASTRQACPSDGWVTGWQLAEHRGTALASTAVRERLDEASGGRPVMLMEDSRHNRWANTRALELAGITAAHDAPARAA